MERSLIKIAKIATSILCYLLGILLTRIFLTRIPINWTMSMYWFLVVEIITCFLALIAPKKSNNSREISSFPGIICCYIILGIINYSGLAFFKSFVALITVIVSSIAFLFMAYEDNIFC